MYNSNIASKILQNMDNTQTPGIIQIRTKN